MKLRDFQTPHANRLLEILREHRSALDGSDCGVGKTYAACWVAAQLQLETLVICPLSVVPTWEAILADAGVNKFTVINYESAWRKLGTKVPYGKGSFFKWNQHWPFFIFDELHRCQSTTTMQGKMLIAATRMSQLTGSKILGLSATVADSPLKLGPLGYALNLHSLSNFRDWLDRHGCPERTMGSGKKQWKERVFLKSARDEVMSRLNHEIYDRRGARLRIEDIPNFPTTQISVRMIEGHAKEVKRLDDDLRKFYDNRQLMANLSPDELAQLTFARQAMEIAKVPALIDMIGDALETSKVVVFCNYSATLDALAAECDKRKWFRLFIRGEQSAEERQETIHEFQSDRLDVCLANTQAGGVGVSLHSLAKYPRTAFHCPTFSSVDQIQCFGRVRRDGGGTSNQFIVFFKGTVEERVAKAVQAKIDRIDLLNDGDMQPMQEALAI